MRTSKLLPLVLFLGTFHPAFGDEGKTKEGGDKDYEMLKILTHHCAGCHQAADHPGALFLNQARLNEKETIDLITNLLEHNRMPPAHSNFKKTKDGKKLLAWLKEKQKELGTKKN